MPERDEANPDGFASFIEAVVTAHATHPEGAVVPEPEPTEE